VKFIVYQCLLWFLDESTVNGLQQERLNARDFDVIKVIGRGAFGEVQLVSKLFDVNLLQRTPMPWFICTTVSMLALEDCF